MIFVNNPLISVIIVAYNSDEYLRDCLKSLFRARYKHLEILVVDNNSKDKTRDIINSFRKRISHIFLDNNVGYAGANNIGIKHANGEFIFLLNPDTKVDINIFNNLLKAFRNNADMVVGQPIVYLMKDSKRVNLTGKVTHFLGFDWVRGYKKTMYPCEGEIMSFSGCGVMIKKFVFNKTKAFDQNYFMYYEDSDLSWRLRLFGYKLMFVPSAIMYHDYKYIPVEQYQSLKSKLFYNERNRIMTLYKNYSMRTIVLLLPAALFLEFCMILYALFGGWCIEKIKGYVSIIALRHSLQKNRVFVQKNRVASDREIVRDFMSTLNTKIYNNGAVKILVNPFLFCYWSLAKNFI